MAYRFFPRPHTKQNSHCKFTICVMVIFDHRRSVEFAFAWGNVEKNDDREKEISFQ